MTVAFLDLEWGQIYGTHISNSMLTEAGLIIAEPGSSKPRIYGKRFVHDIDLVLRKNKVNSYGKTVGCQVEVVNFQHQQYSTSFDQSYKLSKLQKKAARQLRSRALAELKQFLVPVLGREHVESIVLFGGQNDVAWLNQAGIDCNRYLMVDIQRLLRDQTKYLFSLDKISHVIGFRFTDNSFGSQQFTYPVARKHVPYLKPHNAVGDVCRIFTLTQWMCFDQAELLHQCQQYLSQSKTGLNRAPYCYSKVAA